MIADSFGEPSTAALGQKQKYYLKSADWRLPAA
jgi:hypothetical protein